MENFLDPWKIFVQKFFDHRKIICASLLKMILYNKTNTSVESIKIYVSKSGAKSRL